MADVTALGIGRRPARPAASPRALRDVGSSTTRHVLARTPTQTVRRSIPRGVDQGSAGNPRTCCATMSR